jgi:CRISPR/Cas system-associated protein Cas10 (large subunit of type III CRISPR-Cas system)
MGQSSRNKLTLEFRLRQPGHPLLPSEDRSLLPGPAHYETYLQYGEEHVPETLGSQWSLKNIFKSNNNEEESNLPFDFRFQVLHRSALGLEEFESMFPRPRVRRR